MRGGRGRSPGREVLTYHSQITASTRRGCTSSSCSTGRWRTDRPAPRGAQGWAAPRGAAGAPTGRRRARGPRAPCGSGRRPARRRRGAPRRRRRAASRSPVESMKVDRAQVGEHAVLVLDRREQRRAQARRRGEVDLAVARRRPSRRAAVARVDQQDAARQGARRRSSGGVGGRHRTSVRVVAEVRRGARRPAARP